MSLTPAALERLVRRAGRMALPGARRLAGGGRLKRDGTWVTATDRAIERLIRDSLRQGDDVRVFGEEAGWTGEPDARYVAIVDPIDGTDAYRNGMPFWGVSLAVFERTAGGWRPRFGAFYMPHAGHLFLSRNGRAWWNGRRLRVPRVASAIPSTSYLGVSSDAHRWNLEGYPGKVRAFGASGLQVVMVATGMLQASLLSRFYYHDIAGAALVLRAAGGELYSLSGEALTTTALVEAILRDPGSRPPPLVACHPTGLGALLAARCRPRREG
jgi:fructose-1,6-bisphosphatase/inositol monophosphatase family enzyme